MNNFVWQLGYGFMKTIANRRPFCHYKGGEQTKYSLFHDSLRNWKACRLSITIDGNVYGNDLQLVYYQQDEFNVTVANTLKETLASMEAERSKLLTMPPLPEGYGVDVLQRFYCSLPEGERKEVWNTYEGIGEEADKRARVALLLENKKTITEARPDAEAAAVDATVDATVGAARGAAEATATKKRPRDPAVEEAARQQQSIARAVGGIRVGDGVNFIGKDEVIERAPWKRGRSE